MTQVHLPSRSFRFKDFEQIQNTMALLTGTQQNGVLRIKANGRSATIFSGIVQHYAEKIITGSTFPEFSLPLAYI